MPATVYTSAVITLNAALHGYAPSNTVFNTEVATAAMGVNAFANSMVSSSMSNADLSALVLGNMGLLPNADLNTALTQVFALNSTARGQVILNLAGLLSGLSGDATYGAAANAWNAASAQAYAYSSAGVDSAVPVPFSASGITFVLTARTAAGADVMGLTGDQDVRIDFTKSSNQITGLDLNGNGTIDANGVENAITGKASGFEIVDAYARNPLNEMDRLLNFLGDIKYDGTGFKGDGVNTNGNIFLGGLGADTALGGVGNDFLAGGGIAQNHAGTDFLSGGRNADFFFAELALLSNTDGNRIAIDGGTTADNTSAGTANSTQNADWLLLQASDDDEPVRVVLDDHLVDANGNGNVDDEGLIATRNGVTVGTLKDVENFDGSGNFYGFLKNVNTQLGGAPSGAANPGNNGIGSSAQLNVSVEVGSTASHKIIGGYDNDSLTGASGADLLMGGNLNMLINPNLVGIVNDGRDLLTGGLGSDNIVFEADGGIIEGGATQNADDVESDTLWLTRESLGTGTATTMTTDNTLRFDLGVGKVGGVSNYAGYGGADAGGTGTAFTADQTNYTGASRVQVQDMESVIATGLGAIDFVAAGSNAPELVFDNQQNFRGYAGNLDLRGTTGSNTLYASAGIDTIEGREGDDNLSGGSGDDKFVFFLQAGTGDGVDVIHRQADANGDNLWDGYNAAKGTGGTFVQDFGEQSSPILSDSKLYLTLTDTAHPADLTGFPVNGVAFKLDGVAYTVALTSGVQSGYAEFTAGLNAALDANPALAGLDAVLNADKTITVTDPAGKAFVAVGYTWVGNVTPPAGTLTWNLGTAPANSLQTQDQLVYASYFDRLDGELVHDDAVVGTNMSLGVDAYAQDLVVGFAADGTRIAEDQQYTLTFDNLTTRDKVSIDVNGVTYSLQVGVGLDGEALVAEDGVGDTQAGIQTAFLARLTVFINTFMDKNTAAGEVTATNPDGATIVLTQHDYNNEETVFMKEPVVEVAANSSHGEPPSVEVANTSQHEVWLFNFDGRNNKLNEADVRFVGDTGTNRATFETALTAGQTLTGKDASVVDGGADDLAGYTVNLANNFPLLQLNFSIHGDDLLLGGDGLDTIKGGTGDDRVLGSLGTDNLDGGKNYYQVQVLGETQARVVVWNDWEAKNPASAQSLLADPSLTGKVLSSIKLINQSQNGTDLVAGSIANDGGLMGSGLFDDTLLYQQADFDAANTRFTITLDDYTVTGAGVVELRHGGAGHASVDVNGNGIVDGKDATSAFANFENIRTVSGTGLAVAGDHQGNDTLNVSMLSAAVTGAGGIQYNLTGDAEAGKVEYSTDTVVSAATATTPTATALGDRPNLNPVGVPVDDYESLVMKVDGVENVIAGTGNDSLRIDQTEAAKDNRFEAGTGVDRVEYLNDYITGGPDVLAQPTVTIKVNSGTDTDTVTMKGGRVGTLATTSGGAVDTLVGVEYIALNGETAQSNREDDLLDVSAMVTGAVIDYTNGEVRAVASGGVATNVGVQLVIENIVQIENVLADGDDTVIVADADVMNNNARSDEGTDAKPAVDIQLATYMDYDTFDTTTGSRIAFASQSAAQVTDVINQNQFTFNLGTVGVDTVDYSNELGRIAAVMNFTTTDPNKFVLVDGDSDATPTAGNLGYADGESRIDKLVSVERIAASQGDSIIDITNSGRDTNVIFSYNQPDQKTAFVEGTHKVAALDRQVNVVRVADAANQAALGNVDLIEYRDLGDSATIAQPVATWNSVQGSDYREYVQLTQWENQLAHTLTLRGGANEVNYNERTDGIYIKINSVDTADHQFSVDVSHLSSTGVNLGSYDTITGYNQKNVIGGAANSLRIEASQGDQDFVDVSGLTASGIFLMGQVETSGSSVVTATFVDPVTGVSSGSGLTLSGFEYLWDGVGADTYVINDLTNFVSKMTLVDWAQSYNVGTNPATFLGSTDRDTLKLTNGAFETGTMRPPISQTITINSNLSMGTVADANDLQRIGVNNNTQRAAFGTAFEIGNGGLAETSRGFDFQVLDISEVTNQTLLTATGSGATEGSRDELIVGGLNYLNSAGTAIQGFDILSLTNASSGTVFELDKTAGELQGSTNTKIVGVDALLNTLDLSRITGRDVTLTATSAAAVTLIGGAGNDTVTGSAGADTVVGGAGNDTLNGGTAAEVREIQINPTGVTGAGAITITLDGNVYTLNMVAGAPVDVDPDAGDNLDVTLGGGSHSVGAALATLVTANLDEINATPAFGGTDLQGVAYSNTTGLLTFTFVGGADVAVTDTIVIAGAGLNTVTVAGEVAVVNGGDGGVDTFEFAGSAAANGVDTITGFTPGALGDRLDVAGTNAKGAALFLTAISTYNDEAAALTVASTGELDVNNEVAFINANGTALTAATLAAEFSATGAPLTAYLANGIDANGVGLGMKAVIVEIDSTLVAEAAKVWFVNDANNDGAIASSEVVLVGTLTGAGDFNFDTANFI